MSGSEEEQTSSPRVFISYSQHDPDDPAHSQRVLGLARALLEDGIDVELDQFHQHEMVDWPRWCEERLRPENSDFVLMICTAEYKRRIEGKVPADEGRGVYGEGGLIDDYLYEAKANERFVPVLLDDEPESSIPRIVRGWTWFRLHRFGLDSGDRGYTDLCRLLTEQPGTPKPERGEVVALPPEPEPEPTPGIRPNKPANLPYPSLGALFKGRDDFLAEIRADFDRAPGRMQAIIARQAIHGLGGIGKTRAAVEYAWRRGEGYTALLFVAAQTPAGFRANLAGLCETLGIERETTDETARAKAALQWLGDPSHHGWLLIVDNADTPEAAAEVDETLGTLGGGHVLVTGRLSEWPGHVDARRLDVLDADAAAEFLLARTRGKRQAAEDDAEQAGKLARELDGLALALEQAAAFIRRHAIGFAEYRRRWEGADQRVREWHDARTMKYDRPLATTWQTTVDALPRAARALLDLLCWLGTDPLPRFLFDHEAAPAAVQDLFENGEGPREILGAFSGDPRAEPESALATLREFSLLQPAGESGFESAGQLHRVLALITRERQSREERAKSLKAALRLVDVATVGDSADVRSWAVWDPLRGHVRAVVDAAEQVSIVEPTARLLNDLGRLLSKKAQHGEAEPLIRRALAIAEKSIGPERPEVAIILNNLAGLLQEMNRLGEAEPLMRRAVAVLEKSLGGEHPNVATAINNLAQLLKATGRLAEAEPLMRWTLAVAEKSFGTEHPDVARDLGNLAGLLQETNRPGEAEPLMRRTLAIDENSFGPEHPEVARDLNNLAGLLQETNRLAEAEPLMRRHLSILLKFTRGTGHFHPHLRVGFGNYVRILKEMSVDDGEIDRRLAEMGREAGLDEEAYGRVVEHVGGGK